MSGIEVTEAHVRMVSTRVVVPHITCSSTDSEIALFASVSKGGVAGRFPLHSPRRSAVAGILMHCSGGVLLNTAALQINVEPHFSHLNVSPGDTVILTAKQTPRGGEANIKDVTTGKSATFTGTPGSNGGKDDAADIGVLANPGTGMAPFGTVEFLHNQVDTAAVSGLSPAGFDYFDGTAVTVVAGAYDTVHNKFAVSRL